MPVYNSNDAVKHGVPFGGIGTGKFEITPQGLFNAFTVQNNWSQPLVGNDDCPGVLGYHLGFFVEGLSRNNKPEKKAFLLQTVPIQNIPTVKNIRYEGYFPKARLYYEEPSLGVDVSLEVFSPLIPGDIKNSSLPAAIFNLKVKNNRSHPVKIGFLLIARNTAGDWCVGRRNRVYEDKKSVAIDFSNLGASEHDIQQGAMRFTFLKDGWRTSFMEYWNAVTKNFSFTSKDISLAAWDYFVSQGELPNAKPGFTAASENQELCGALMAERTLSPKATGVLSFNAVWYFPKHSFGHYYERYFKNTSEISRYVISKQNYFKHKVEKLHELVSSFSFPDWFKDALLTNLAPFFASSWYTKDGRFAFYEAPVMCPLMGTVDVGFYGSVPLSYFFPELEAALITQFAKAQRKNGYIPHDLGKNRLDSPSNGTTYYLWKDLNPKFILMVYRDYLWSGNKHFLKALYPHVKRALQWTISIDHDGNGLPDHEGEDQTFDLWKFQGVNAYTAGIFLAALLACEKMGRVMLEESFAKDCRKRFVNGCLSFDRELWNGEYFGETCNLSQLHGQWIADLLGLGLISEKEKIKKAIQSIWKRNARFSKYGIVNSTMPDGQLDVSNSHSKNAWLGLNYAFISLCITQGFPLDGLLKETRKIWDNTVYKQKSPWNMPDMIDAKTGQYLFGDFDYRNMAIWAIPVAYALRDKKTATILKALRSLGRAKT